MAPNEVDASELPATVPPSDTTVLAAQAAVSEAKVAELTESLENATAEINEHLNHAAELDEQLRTVRTEIRTLRQRLTYNPNVEEDLLRRLDALAAE